MAGLFDPITVGNHEFKNRLWVPAMCMYSSMEEDGMPGQWHLVHYGQFALGGAALTIVEATSVVPEGRISPRDTGIWNDEQAAAWKRITDFVHAQGAAIGIQLAHAGRKAGVYAPWGETQRGPVPLEDGGWTPFGPGEEAYPGLAEPAALDEAGIRDVITAFAEAAKRSVTAGFDVIEIHAAHGYLIHQFLSPLSNTREDEWGGSFENRTRLLREIVREVRAAAPEVTLFVRFSASDWLPGGWDIDQTRQAALIAVDEGADFFDISSGGNAPATIPLEPGYQVPFAAAISDDVNVAAVGLITQAEQAQEIVSSGKAHAVFVGRAALANPHFALNFAHELGVDKGLWPGQYERAV
ncbi:NADH:flavin oxidoreductase/NADH oxidase [Humidisolicoccus flavus]|uniref:NADH:flavin oxidoreductase/NADH oxidase n=1 Tax=Humidisolicoccus flavus TaxID=3111414 RepID=UPI00324C761E